MNRRPFELPPPPSDTAPIWEHDQYLRHLVHELQGALRGVRDLDRAIEDVAKGVEGFPQWQRCYEKRRAALDVAQDRVGDLCAWLSKTGRDF